MTKLILIPALCFLLAESQAKEISVFPSSRSVRTSAEELSGYLNKIYTEDNFVVRESFPKRGDVIVLSTDPALGPEEFTAVSKNKKRNRTILTIAGGSPAGVKYGVYQLMENLGCGFYLSREVIPALKTVIKLDNIHFTNSPLVEERLIFNWHNFLSGCSSWDYADWKQYIDNASGMRYNGLMMHFYANDPSITFSHKGIKKIAGYMPNTANGRQYGTQQVNDVTRMVAGDIFKEPVFGSEASKVPDSEREQAARTFVRSIHKYAVSKSMKIWMGFDVDYPLANPPEIMAALPAAATVKINRRPNKYFGMPFSDITLPVPDSDAGYDYYKSLIKQIFLDYPEIENLVLWTRTEGSAFLTLRYEEFPEVWKREFDRLSVSNQKINKADEKISGRFATAKIYSAVRKALDETGKPNIKLWAGSWRSSWLHDADMFYPSEVGFIPLDYETDFLSDPEKMKIIKQVSENREIIPVVWAHHDDGNYIGSPFVPYPDVHLRINESGSLGVGVIHWTTKPLDIYFKNMERQLWKMSAGETIEETAAFIAERLVPSDKADKFTNYLARWVNEGPKFGRETRTYFFDRKISDQDFNDILRKCNERISLIDELDERDNPHVMYFRALEEFCISFYKTQYFYQNALTAFNSGDFDKSAGLLSSCRPEAVIKQYSDAAILNGITKGEQGVILKLNLGWLPYIFSLKQTLRQMEVRYNFGLTNFPDIGVGLLETNYFIDKDKNLWRNYGERETGGSLFYNNQRINDSGSPDIAEICASGIRSKDSIVISLKPQASDISPAALKVPDFFLPGKYKLTMIFNEHEFTNAGNRIFEINIEGSNNKLKPVSEPVDIFKESGGINKVFRKTLIVELKEPESLKISIYSINGECLINGLVMEPLSN